ncbi:FhaA domain-containing protein [Phosphitispora sp. TUW77]|uniref:FhaA domain-containing protein n=1 Tax=Phosphitispora sp. TUW77 TaxID=3152361 RepID=UPI003AB51E49
MPPAVNSGGGQLKTGFKENGGDRMGFFNKLEKISEKYIEGFFKTKFADNIQPAEIAKLIIREMRDHKNVSVSKVYVPNEFKVFLGDEDWKTVAPVRQALAHELIEFLREKVQSRDYNLTGEITVAFELDKSLQLGNITVHSSFSKKLPVISPKAPSVPVDIMKEMPRKVSESTIIAEKTNFYKPVPGGLVQDTLTGKAAGTVYPRALLVQKTGSRDIRKFPLSEKGLIMGRRRSSDIPFDDSNISRVHASIDYLEGSFFVTDLGSTNGTYVNGVRISKKKLSHGDQIRMGTILLEFRLV